MDFQPGTKTADSYLALPPSGAGPGVLVLHAWWGLNSFFTGLCDRLAGEGYVALAPDLYAGAVAATVKEAEALMNAANQDEVRLQRKVVGALDALVRNPAVRGEGVGVLGCSMGVPWALHLSALRPEQVAAAVLFYSVGEADYSAARCAYLGHFAENDVFDSLEDARAMVAQMRAAGRDVTVYEYPGVGHWFLESDRPDAYAPAAARLAWERTLAFLDRHLR